MVRFVKGQGPPVPAKQPHCTQKGRCMQESLSSTVLVTSRGFEGARAPDMVVPWRMAKLGGTAVTNQMHQACCQVAEQVAVGHQVA